MKQPLFIIVAGDGVNCERETARAIELSGGKTKIIHINDLLETPEALKQADGLALPGGFSFGDELGSGQILALKIKHKLGDAFFGMVNDAKPIIGICNGFQVLVKLGLLPFANQETRTVALAANESGHFIDRWVELNVNKDSVCKWTQGLKVDTLDLPIRHGEGRVVLADDSIYADLQAKGQIPLTYTEDVNGSHGKIAALTDPSGVVLGLMPHPEAFVSQSTNATPQQDVLAGGSGALIFNNIIRLLEGQENPNARRTA